MKHMVLFGVILLGLSFSAYAGVPKLINYSGKIVDKSGNLLPDTDYDMRFNIYSGSSGPIVWSEQHLFSNGQSVHTTNGAYSVILGSIAPLGNSSTAFDADYYLEMSFKKPADSTWEIFGKQQMISVPYSVRAEYANQVADNSVNSSKIVDGAITTADLADNSVTFNKLIASAVASILPIGSIIAWHREMPNTPALPSCFKECNGQIVTDPSSPYYNQNLPNLNGEARFLRGGASSGVPQDDAIKSHTHTVFQGATGSNDQWHLISNWGAWGGDITSGSTGDTETRPKNMSVIWIMKIK